MLGAPTQSVSGRVDMAKQERTTRLVRCIAVTDTAGAPHFIDEYGEFLRLQTRQGQWGDWTRTGGKLLVDGRQVNPTPNPNVFQLSDTEEFLTVIREAPRPQSH